MLSLITFAVSAVTAYIVASRWKQYTDSRLEPAVVAFFAALSVGALTSTVLSLVL